MKNAKRGTIVIISSPSGGGKTSICRRLLTPSRKRQGWQFSVSFTTRQRRPGEKNGREYFFVSEDKFNLLSRRGFFAEHCQVHLYYYGTPRKPLENVLKKGGVMLLDVDVQGALKLKREYPHAITVFVLPPSVAALRKRLKKRGTESVEQLKVRFENAKKEMKLYRRFEYAVINDDLRTAVRQVACIICSHHCRTEHLDQEQIKKILVKY
ncbi:MAG: guanylate kinase [Candidatus Zixiibacteriota bacterium]